MIAMKIINTVLSSGACAVAGYITVREYRKCKDKTSDRAKLLFRVGALCIGFAILNPIIQWVALA